MPRPDFAQCRLHVIWSVACYLYLSFFFFFCFQQLVQPLRCTINRDGTSFLPLVLFISFRSYGTASWAHLPCPTAAITHSSEERFQHVYDFMCVFSFSSQPFVASHVETLGQRDSDLGCYGGVRLPVEKHTLFVNLVWGFEIMHGVGRGSLLRLSFALLESTLPFCCIYQFI